MGSVLTFLKDALYPRKCPACHDAVSPFGAFICKECRASFSYIEGPCCSICGKGLANTDDTVCAACMRIDNPLSGGISLFHYDDTARSSIAKFKYEGRREYAEYYIEQMLEKHGAQLRAMRADAVVPVPVHKSRLRQRGYNQALELADKLGRALGLPVEAGLLCRKKRTRALKELGAEERSINLREAFCVAEGKPVPGRIILMDDILTTGLTMKYCAQALFEAGVKKVFGCSICASEDY